jgi:hypothetical protein
VEKAPDLPTEARWPVLVALIGLGGIFLALPKDLVFGPRWLLLAMVGALTTPAYLAHRAGHHRLDAALGYAASGLVTLALAVSLGLLVHSLPDEVETPAELLVSAAALWGTNVLVFSLWYWRLDAGGPHRRDSRGSHFHGAFLFPQMLPGAPGGGRWTPRYLDYLFLAFNTGTAFSPTDTAVLSRWAKVLSMVQSLISLTIVGILASRAVGML